MKSVIIAAAMAIPGMFFAQEVKVKEGNETFSNGSHNSIIVNIPYGKLDVVEKEIKSELKDWGGKYNSTKGEWYTKGASMKSMGDKPFDAYARVVSSDEKEIKVAFTVDLGGAYMDSKAHGSQFNAIESKVKKFANRAANESVAEELAVEGKVLKEMNSNKADMEKSIASSKKDIEEYKKKIEEAEKKIKENEDGVAKKSGEIGTQTNKISEIEKKKKGIK